MVVGSSDCALSGPSAFSVRLFRGFSSSPNRGGSGGIKAKVDSATVTAAVGLTPGRRRAWFRGWKVSHLSLVGARASAATVMRSASPGLRVPMEHGPICVSSTAVRYEASRWLRPLRCVGRWLNVRSRDTVF